MIGREWVEGKDGIGYGMGELEIEGRGREGNGVEGMEW